LADIKGLVGDAITEPERKKIAARLAADLARINAEADANVEKRKAEYEGKDSELRWQANQLSNRLTRLFDAQNYAEYDAVTIQWNNKKKEINDNYQKYRNDLAAINAKRYDAERNARENADYSGNWMDGLTK
jgi:hypothetical protein